MKDVINFKNLNRKKGLFVAKGVSLNWEETKGNKCWNLNNIMKLNLSKFLFVNLKHHLNSLFRKFY